MRAFQWIYLVLFCSLLSGMTVYAQGAPEPAFTRIGRGAVQSAQWSPDGSYILVATVTGAWLYTPDLHDLAHIPDALLATLSPDGRYIAGTPDGKSVNLWDAKTVKPFKMIENFMRQVTSVSWSPDSLHLTVAGNWDADYLATFSIESPSTFDNRSAFMTVSQIQWSPDGRYLALYNSSQQQVVVLSADSPQPIFAQALSADGAAYLTWGDSNHLFVFAGGEIMRGTLWEIPSGKTVYSGDVCTSSQTTFSPDRKILYVGCYGEIRIFNALTFAPLGKIGAGAYPTAFSMTTDGSTLASSTWQPSDTAVAQVSVIDVLSGTLLQTIDTLRGGVAKLLWRPGQAQLLVVGGRGEIDVFDVAQKHKIATQKAHTISNGIFSWSSDSTRIAAADTVDSVNLWDAATGDLVKILNGNNEPITEIEWEPHGDLIATRGGDFWQNDDPVIHIWDAKLPASQALIHTLTFPKSERPVSMGWSPDGQRLASAAGGRLYLWNIDDLAHAQEIRLSDENGLTGGMRWSHKGDQIAVPYSSSGSGGAIYIYDVTTGGFTSDNASNYATTWSWTLDNTLMWLSWGDYGDVGYVPPKIEPEIRIVERPDVHKTLYGLTQAITGAFLSPSGRYAAALEGTGSGMVWDVHTDKPITMLADVAQVMWSPDETHFGVQRSDGSFWILAANGTLQEELHLSVSIHSAVGTFDWSPDSSKLVHLHDNIIDLWHWSN
jgi:WD40 repeat protein